MLYLLALYNYLIFLLLQQLDVALPGNTYCERKTQLIIDSTFFLFASEEHVESILICFAVLRKTVISDILLFLHATRKKLYS